MKKKLLVLLIALASTMMPNLASAIAIDVWDLDDGWNDFRPEPPRPGVN